MTWAYMMVMPPVQGRLVSVVRVPQGLGLTLAPSSCLLLHAFLTRQEKQKVASYTPASTRKGQVYTSVSQAQAVTQFAGHQGGRTSIFPAGRMENQGVVNDTDHLWHEVDGRAVPCTLSCFPYGSSWGNLTFLHYHSTFSSRP